MIRSKFSSFVYGWTLCILPFIFLGVYFLLHPAMRTHNKFGGTNSAIIPGLILVIGMSSILFFVLRTAYTLRIDKDRLFLFYHFTGKTIERTNLRTIRLWDKKGNHIDALVIETHDSKPLTLSDVYCRNMPELKRALLDWYGEFIPPAPDGRQRPSHPTAGSIGDTEAYRGNPILSMYGLFFYATVVGIMLTARNIPDMVQASGWISFIIFLPLLFLAIMLGRQLYYFRITTDSLEIKNHVFPWYKKAHLLEEINSIAFERGSKSSRTLLIRTAGFGSFRYAAGSLWDKHWKALEKALKKCNIPVQRDF